MNDMHAAVLAKLDFPAVLDRLATRCRFGVAADRARELGPSGDYETVAYLLEVTAEAVDLLTRFPEVTIGGPRDIRALVERAAKGGRLQPADLLLVQDTLVASRLCRRSFFRLPDAEQVFPHLLRFAEHLVEMPDLETTIGRTIGPRGDVLDTASEELGRIRRDVRIAQSRLMDRLNSLVSGGKYANVLQDAIITTRDGRYVLPVRSEARGSLPGVVHDTSASGQTIFVEPFEIVELNNRWRERQLDEQHEIERILDHLSDQIGRRAGDLNQTVEGVAAIDLAMAKARLAFDLNATRPTLAPPARTPNVDGHATHRISLVQARHPLLDPATVVPTTISLGDDYRVLLITGPNTGGKTVALKTVGLLTMMAQTGLFIPADDRSVLSVFPAIFADIGDEQSIAQSLSTFSAHMRTVIAMLAQVTPDSLVLLDELGAGTDPQEGSALARALIADLLNSGPLVIATTHYSEVKAFAYSTPGVENASVEFDVATLAPTYRLMIGVPGRSNALAIARRLGMPQSIVTEATALLDPDELRADTLLQDIRRRRDEADQLIGEAEASRRAARAELAAAEAARIAADQERQGARAEALATAEAELAEVRETLRRLQRDRETVMATKEHVETRRLEVDQAANRVREFRRTKIKPPAPQLGKVIRPGDRVRIISLDEVGEVLAVADNQADVMLGTLKMRQPLAALERLGRARDDSSRRVVYTPAAAAPVSIEVDLRGHRAAEVEEMLDQYLENAYRAGLPFVRIIHGKGTGALRQVVRDILNQHPVVSGHQLAPREQGGDGATVATLKDDK